MPKKSLTCFTLLLTCAISAFSQGTPLEITTDILHKTTADPAAGFTSLYTLWQYNAQAVGSFGYTSSDGGIRLNNTIGDINILSGSATGSLKFYTNNLNRMHITSGGNIGIGTTSP